MPYVYLIHFGPKGGLSTPYKHARHYLGYTSRSIEERLARHAEGRGARLMEVIKDAGVEWECVRVWRKGTRALERKLKKLKNAPRLCPRCRAEAEKTV